VIGKAGHEHNVERMIGGKRTIAHRIGNAPAPAELHGANIDLVHFRRGDDAVALLNQLTGDAAPAEFVRKREPDRTAADDQHRHATRGGRGLRHQNLRRP
jgi:hypothetical protein